MTKHHFLTLTQINILNTTIISVGEKPYAFYDLLRVANGKLAEHWDVMTEIPSKSDWKTIMSNFKKFGLIKYVIFYSKMFTK